MEIMVSAFPFQNLEMLSSSPKGVEKETLEGRGGAGVAVKPETMFQRPGKRRLRPGKKGGMATLGGFQEVARPGRGSSKGLCRCVAAGRTAEGIWKWSPREETGERGPPQEPDEEGEGFVWDCAHVWARGQEWG